MQKPKLGKLVVEWLPELVAAGIVTHGLTEANPMSRPASLAMRVRAHQSLRASLQSLFSCKPATIFINCKYPTSHILFPSPEHKVDFLQSAWALLVAVGGHFIMATARKMSGSISEWMQTGKQIEVGGL